jgi:hypothetical protein
VANGRLILTDAQQQALFTPAPYGLLDTATELPELPPHWQQGLTWEPICAEGFTTYSRCLVVVDASDVPLGGDVTEEEGGPPEPPAKEASTFHQIRGATPFAAGVEIDCSPQAGPDRIRARAAEALTRVEQRQVEATFWTGVAAGEAVVWPHLAAETALVEPEAGGAELQPAVTVLSGSTPLDIVAAVGLLEEALGDCYDGVGTLHVPRLLVPYMAASTLVTARAGLLNTPLGTKVAAGRGYPGTSPAGVDSEDVRWIFATGEVFYRRGDIWQPNSVESFNRGNNTVRAMAERTYVLGWDCCLFAVPVLIEEGS